jgi:hypothetical protein
MINFAFGALAMLALVTFAPPAVAEVQGAGLSG